MPSSDISSAWDDLSRDDFTSSASKNNPVSPTSPSSSTRSRQQALGKDSLSLGFVQISISPVGTQGQQTRQVSGGSVDSGGSSAWGTLASKSILSEVPSMGDRKLRGGNKVRKVEEADRVGHMSNKPEKGKTRESSSNNGKSTEMRSGLDINRNAANGTDAKQDPQSRLPWKDRQKNVSSERPVVGEAVPSMSVSQATSAAGDQPRKPRSKRGGKKNRSKANTQTKPPAGVTDGGVDSVPSLSKATVSDYSMVDSAVPSTTFDVMTDFSIAEMTKRNRANKNGKRPGKQGSRDAQAEPTVQVDLPVQDLTVTEMTARSKANLKRKPQRARQRARQQAEQEKARADDLTVKPADQLFLKPSTESVAPSIQTDDTFQSQTSTFDGNTSGSGFRMDGRTSHTSRRTTGTLEGSGVVVSRGSVRRGGKQAYPAQEATTASTSKPPTGPGFRPTGLVPSTALHTNTSNANTSQHPPGTAKSTMTDESVAPHHSISRRGSIQGHGVRTPASPATAIIIGLEGLSVDETSARPSARIQPVPKRDALPSQSSLSVPAVAQTGGAKREPSGPGGPTNDDDNTDGRSITSYEEAHSSVRAFLNQDQTFLRDKRNRLAFWQGLCIELGLAVTPDYIEASLARDSGMAINHDSSSPSGFARLSFLDTPTRYMLNLSPLEDDDSASGSDDMDPSRRSSKRRARARSESIASDHTALQGDESRSSTPRPYLPVVPSSSKGCVQMLKTQAHVNLCDWLTVRGKVDVKEQELKRLGRAIEPEEEEELYAPLRALVFPSATQMIRYTHKTKKFKNKTVLKQAWLQPLMKDMHFGSTRRREEYSEYRDQSDRSISTASSAY